MSRSHDSQLLRTHASALVLWSSCRLHSASPAPGMPRPLRSHVGSGLIGCGAPLGQSRCLGAGRASSHARALAAYGGASVCLGVCADLRVANMVDTNISFPAFVGCPSFELELISGVASLALGVAGGSDRRGAPESHDRKRGQAQMLNIESSGAPPARGRRARARQHACSLWL